MEKHSARSVDRLLEDYEADWRPSLVALKQFVGEHCLELNCPVLAELIRVDIDRRYARQQPVNLESYFELFSSLSADSEAVAAIAFEDFRSRRSRGLATAQERYFRYPQLAQASWLGDLASGFRRAQAPRNAAGRYASRWSTVWRF
jgi:hypothetical protein